MTSAGIMNLLHEAWQVQGIRAKISDPKQKRHEFKCTHSFRKAFESKCQKSKMNHNNIKLLMDHSLAESQNYYRPEEQDILEDYLNAVDELTINEENRLKIKIEKLEQERDKFDIFAMKVADNFRNIEEKLVKLKAEGNSLSNDDFGIALDEFAITPSFGLDKKTGKVILDTSLEKTGKVINS